MKPTRNYGKRTYSVGSEQWRGESYDMLMQMAADEMCKPPPALFVHNPRFSSFKPRIKYNIYDIQTEFHNMVEEPNIPSFLPEIVIKIDGQCKRRPLSDAQNKVFLEVYRRLCWEGIFSDSRYKRGVANHAKHRG